MIDHTMTATLTLDHETILKAFLKVVDRAADLDKNPQGSTGLS